MIIELEEMRTINKFTVHKMQDYCKIFILYNAFLQGITDEISVSCILSKLKLEDDIRNILERYIPGIVFEKDDFKRYSIGRIEHYFKHFITVLKSDYMETSGQMSFLAAMLLNVSENDRIADFYGSPFCFSKVVLREVNKNFCNNPTVFLRDERIKDFLILKDNVINETKSQIDYCIVGEKLDSYPDKKFNKIYSFIPIFKHFGLGKMGTSRELRNHIFAEDDSFNYIKNVVNHLDENGQAVICICDDLYAKRPYMRKNEYYEGTPMYHNIRKYLCESGFFEGLIRFPPGEIYPNNFGSTLLIINKNKKDEKIRFLDLCDLSEIPQRRSVIDALGVNKIISLFLGQEERNDVYFRDLNPDDIRKENYEFNTKQKFNLEKFFANNHSENEVLSVAEGNENVKSIRLGECATISRGIQDTQGVSEYSTQNYDFKYYYLGVSDINIDDGEIQYSEMQRLKDKKDSWNSYFLMEGDIILSKTAFPLKVAIYEGSDKRVLPASNLFVIRIHNFGEECKLNPYYLRLYFSSPLFEKWLRSNIDKGRLPSLTKELLKDLEIPFKTEFEQKQFEKEYKNITKQIFDCKEQLKALNIQINNILDFNNPEF